LSFVRTLWGPLQRHLRASLVLFVGIALAFYMFLGRPVQLLILAGGLNGLILPVTLGVVLVAARRRDLMGEYRHPATWLAAGWLAWAVSLAAGAIALGQMARLWLGG
jgi:Mn2+/Fe2+ NRAMP family transporter